MSNLEFIHLTTVGLPEDNDSFVIAFSMLPGFTSFDNLQSKLLFYKQCLSCKKDCNISIHQAFATTTDVQGQGGA